jgi:uncharacterized membrane protein YgdD (TMEM256/DUF423 family)
MQKIFFVAAAILGGLAVALGAYGAHGGANVIAQNDAVITFEKAVRYQMHHALILFAVVWGLSEWKDQTKLLKIAGWLFLAGVLLFSGSLYIIAFTGIGMGYLTPLGGIAFIAGWFFLAFAGYKAKIK